MAKHPSNRLHSLWPSSGASHDGAVAHFPDAKQMAEKLEPMIESVGTAIADHPRASLTVAAALGALLGWFIKRS